LFGISLSGAAANLKAGKLPGTLGSAFNVIQLSIRALILEGFENLPSHLPETFHSHLHKSMRSFRKGVRENPFSKGFSP
jgi:hypothetical protein